MPTLLIGVSIAILKKIKRSDLEKDDYKKVRVVYDNGKRSIDTDVTFLRFKPFLFDNTCKMVLEFTLPVEYREGDYQGSLSTISDIVHDRVGYCVEFDKTQSLITVTYTSTK